MVGTRTTTASDPFINVAHQCKYRVVIPLLLPVTQDRE